MKLTQAVDRFAALAHETRLEALRLLVRAGPDGLPAGRIADRLGIAAATMSFHLAHLERAGVLRSEREGRVIRYRADYAELRALVAFLLEDCCRGIAGSITADDECCR